MYIALPLLDENEFLPRLTGCLSGQTFRDFTLFACVNQPDEWWDDPEKVRICHENRRSLQYLSSIRDFPVVILDRSSRGNGWKGKCHGVGWARKTVMDAINNVAGEDDIIVSLDADTTFSENYLRSVADSFMKFPEALGLAVPYFHKPVPDERACRAILRYEIYMRHYSLNLWRIGSPYSFTALGSAMAFTVRAYRRVGGMTPKMSGEDFYFLQKLRKAGRLVFWNKEKVFPEARFSDRVYFGTGPAMIRGDGGDWSGYPVYHWSFFDEIREFYDQIPALYSQPISSPVAEFFKKQLREEDPFEPLRRNSSGVSRFGRACHEKFDGLRILQYLKMKQKDITHSDEQCLYEFFNRFYGEEVSQINIDLNGFSFLGSDLTLLEEIRMFLMKKEEEWKISSALS